MRRLLLAAAITGAAFAPLAHADTTCQDVNGTPLCVTTNTAQTPGGGVQYGPLCVVVNASCS